MNEKLRLFIDKLFPPEKKLLKDLTKATKRDRLIWHKPVLGPSSDMWGEYRYYDFNVSFKDNVGVLRWGKNFRFEDDTIPFHYSDNGLYAAIMDQQARLQHQKELPNYNRNASIRNILSRMGD